MWADGTRMGVQIQPPPPPKFTLPLLRAHPSLDRVDTVVVRHLPNGTEEYLIVTGTPGAGPANPPLWSRAIALIQVRHAAQFVSADAVKML